jgi:hypothetical protein
MLLLILTTVLLNLDMAIGHPPYRASQRFPIP